MTKVELKRKSLVVLESPYRGYGETREEIALNIELNVTYARHCLRDSILRGESPIASHLLYTQPGVLDDGNPDERRLGTQCGLMWIPAANYGVFYTDRGWSMGMLMALCDIYLDMGFEFRLRSLIGKSGIIFPTNLHDTLNYKLQQFCEE